MDELSAIEEIEADLRFCEDVLNSKAGPPSARRDPARVGSAGAVLETCTAHGGASEGRGERVVPLKQQPPQTSQCRTLRKQLPSPLGKPSINAADSASMAKARTTGELLAMLSSVPAGQPFEIDTGLLYSPQSSFAGGGGHDSPGARSCSPESLVWEEHLHQQQCGSGVAGSSDAAHFLSKKLPAYQPSTHGRQPTAAMVLNPPQSGRYAAAATTARAQQMLASPSGESWQSQQHAAGPPPASQQDQQQFLARSRDSHAAHSLGTSAYTCTAGLRPASAPLQSADSGDRPACQLQMDGALPVVAAGLLRQGHEERIAQLAQPRTDLWQQCARIKVQEENAVLQECTFKPRTGRPPTQQRLAPGMPVEERLQLAHAGRKEALERARVEKEREQLADCTFAPQLVTQPELHLREDYMPLHRRVGQEQKRRSTTMALAQLRRDLGDANLTFQPQLNQRSLQLAVEREEREMFQGHAATTRRPGSAGPPGNRGTDDNACTFSPTINSASERLVEDSATVPTDFQERLRYYSLRKQFKQRAAVEAADAEACTFRPDTGNAVQVLALSASRAGNLLETEQERYNRMANGEAGRLAARRAATEAEMYRELQFKPQLNPRSVAMVPAGSGGVAGLANLADKQRQRLAELREAEEGRQRSHCTFQPDTSKPRVVGYYDEYPPPRANAPISIANATKQGFEGLTQRIADYQADKESRAAAAKAEEQAKELAECSFAPDINRRRVQAKGPVMVRGLERYLELKQLAERQQADAEQRATKVFNMHPRAKQGATVPQPFQLAGHALLKAKAAEKQAALLESTMSDRMRTCTFAPQTNHQRRQQQLQRILGQPGKDPLAGTTSNVQL